MNNFVKNLIRIVIIIAIVFVVISFEINRSVNLLIVDAWRIDYPIYGIRLGDNIENIPENYKQVALTESVWELADAVRFKSPYEEIEAVAIRLDDSKRIVMLEFTSSKPSLDTHSSLVNDVEKEYTILNKKHIDYTPENSTSWEIGLDIIVQDSFTIEIGGKEVTVDVCHSKKGDIYPNGNTYIEYVHDELWAFMKEEK